MWIFEQSLIRQPLVDHNWRDLWQSEKSTNLATLDLSFATVDKDFHLSKQKQTIEDNLLVNN